MHVFSVVSGYSRLGSDFFFFAIIVPVSFQFLTARLQQIINKEDKSKPLNDEQIRKKPAEAGINNITRRTVAKYRKILNVPAARFRKKY